MEPMKPMKPMTSLFDEKSDQAPWWPAKLGAAPSAVGSANGDRYAYFASTHRLVVERGGETQVFDTDGHDITGVSQSSSGGANLVFHDGAGHPLDLKHMQRLS